MKVSRATESCGLGVFLALQLHTYVCTLIFSVTVVGMGPVTSVTVSSVTRVCDTLTGVRYLTKCGMPQSMTTESGGSRNTDHIIGTYQC